MPATGSEQAWVERVDRNQDDVARRPPTANRDHPNPACLDGRCRAYPILTPADAEAQRIVAIFRSNTLTAEFIVAARRD